MLNLASMVVGPLAAPECRRALGRGWVILVRTLAAVALTGVAFVVVWWWWVIWQSEPNHQPNSELRAGLWLIEAMLTTIALVLGPAVLAGSLAGEKERGVLGLLLTTRVSAREIVTGRMAGKLSQVGMILLSGVPAVVLLARLADLSLGVLLALLLMPAAVMFGGGGLSAVASVLSRRGRDALLLVYLVDLLFLISPLASAFGLPPGVLDGLSALNPYLSIEALVWEERVAPALTTSGFWMVLGLTGTAVASWRLRPTCLGAADGDSVRKRHGRRLWVPPVDERRPMLWKELFIERVGSLGRVGSWIGLLLVLILAGGSVGLTALIVWDSSRGGDNAWADWARIQMAEWVAGSSLFVSFLIQWAIGLRASVSISSERERGTWDALLTSPLEAGEIVRGKLWGSLYALRWLIASAYLAWTLGALTGSLRVGDAVTRGGDVLVMGAFMAAIGVRTSINSNTATRAMAVTIGAWLCGLVGVWVTAVASLVAVMAIVNLVLIVLAQSGLIPPLTAPWFPFGTPYLWPATSAAIYLAATLLIVADTRLRFDRMAGRMTSGGLAVAFDQLLYGKPEAPVLVSEANGDLEPPSPPLDLETPAAIAPEDAVAGSG